MVLVNKKNCPICGTEYVNNQDKCKKCKWNLNLYLREQKFSSEQIIRYAESWARNTHQVIHHYRNQRNELRKKMEELPNFMQELFELKLQISTLEKQINNLSNQDSQSRNLKTEILADLDSRINKIVTELVKDLSRENLSTFVATNEPVIPDIVTTEFIDNNINLSESITSNQEIDHYEKYIITQYYNNPSFLVDHAYKVTPTKKSLEDIYMNKASEIIFQDSNQSDYWIVELESGGFCLLPDLNLKINTNLKTIKTIFELRGYQDHLSKNFQVIKTAKVHEVNQNQWQLIDRGILQF
ncbi:hypothetical protein [Geminocystis sp.]|uniref:hypothetical protein n=1 Tax=Geminocystis sp. TaxID=2664100 RepID=UPI003593B2F7